jgi:hypothetical protein
MPRDDLIGRTVGGMKAATLAPRLKYLEMSKGQMKKTARSHSDAYIENYNAA